MGYLHIPNLYKDQDILEFKRCFALEKIHGTSASVIWKDGKLRFFSGGVSHEQFAALFDVDMLTSLFRDRFSAEEPVTVFGEAYGGKCQGMSATYGKDLRFVAFDVKIGDVWLDVPKAAGLCQGLGLEFVDYAEIPTTPEAIDAERDKLSTQAIRNMLADHTWEREPIREGVVLRPPFEVRKNNGSRVIAKHKRAEFSERSSGYPGLLDPAKKAVIENSELIAFEWVTAERLNHVLDHLKAEFQREPEIQWTSAVVRRMTEDIIREAAGEIVDSQDARKAIGHRTVLMFKKLITAIPERNP